MKPERKYMENAIKLAEKSAEKNDYAVGSVIVKDGEIISKGTTRLKHDNDPTVHGEIVAIRKACKKLGSRYLEDCVLYSTHEPCPMCSSAAVWAKMKGIVFGATIEDAENYYSQDFSWRQINIKCQEILDNGSPKLEIVEGFMRESCNHLFKLSS